MNREIKFRIFWNGTMVYNHSFCLTIDGQLSVLREDGEWDVAEEKEFQLMQYTGLNDKHNNPIYQGDKNQDGGVVIWNKDDASFCWEYEGIEVSPMGEENEWCEITGNIFQP